MVLLDLRKAYDSVWHKGLNSKLHKLKYPNYLVKLLFSFLQHRQAYVSVNSSVSARFSVPAGVPQGSIVALHLFNVFINDICIPKEGNLALFADDTAYFIQAPWKNLKLIKKNLIAALTSFQKFFADWKIFLNENKTEFIMFSKSTKMLGYCQSDSIRYNNIDFKWKPHVKYLGVVLDSKLLFKQHVDYALNKAKAKLKHCHFLLLIVP